MYFEGSKDGVEVEVAAQYNDGYSLSMLEFFLLLVLLEVLDCLLLEVLFDELSTLKLF